MKTASRACGGIPALCLLLVACADNASGPGDATISGQTYDNPLLSVSVTTPDGWLMAMDTTLQNEQLLLFASNLLPESSQVVFTVTRNERFEATTDNPFVSVALVRAGLGVLFADHQVVTEDTLVVDSVQCALLVFDATISGFWKRNYLVYVIHDGCHLLLTFSGLPDTIADAADLIQSVLDSVELY
jgi:hypothetical protein